MRSDTKVLPLIAVATILISIQVAMCIWLKSMRVQEQIEQPVDIQLEEPQPIQIDPIREKQIRFVKKYGHLTETEIEILLDTLNENAKNPTIMLCIYKKESDFKKRAESYLGPVYGRGVGQVSEIGLADYNENNIVKYKPEDLYDIRINVIVSCWIYERNEVYGVHGTNRKIIAYNEGHVPAKKKSESSYLDKVNQNIILFEEI